MTAKPLPIPDSDTRQFWTAASQGRLSIQRCEDCGTHVFYPRLVCPHCCSDRLAWKDASGKGRVYSYTVVERSPGAFKDMVPYVVALVDLDEGVRMMSRIRTDDPYSVRIGMPVEVEFDPVSEDVALPVFVVSETRS
jgi:uncharacterized OB-fold protein